MGRSMHRSTRRTACCPICALPSSLRVPWEVACRASIRQALGANPFAPIVPCHRVLAAGGRPGGFSGGQGPLTKLRMLELEGAAWGGSRSLFEGL